MSKRNNITYIKPADPKFLQQLKEQIGYNTGQETIESKVSIFTPKGTFSAQCLVIRVDNSIMFPFIAASKV